VEEEEPDVVPFVDRGGTPPFDGTVYLTPDALTPESPSDFIGLVDRGMAERETFDRRVDDWVAAPSYVFVANYRCGRSAVEVIVNEEFGPEEAAEQALRYSQVLGQIPVGSRVAVRELWIHRGFESAGGGNGSILIHTDDLEAEWDYVEEVLVHESAHTSLDYDFQGAVNPVDWARAKAEDAAFISAYAEEYPDREDIAESYGAYIVWAINQETSQFPDISATIESVMPARLAYFESLGPDFGPLPARCG
jgi:hypothetical protein